VCVRVRVKAQVSPRVESPATAAAAADTGCS